jgi:excisionase family DNA binding protein
MTGHRRRGIVAGLLSVGSRITGALLMLVGRVVRRDGIVAAGKRRFHGAGFERRWISDQDERQLHAAIVTRRLGIDAADEGIVTVAEAARTLGVSVSTVRRRVQRGELKGAYSGGRLTGIVLDQK